MAVSIKVVRVSTVRSELKPGDRGISPTLPKMSWIRNYVAVNCCTDCSNIFL
jgi:hypothetical protein